MRNKQKSFARRFKCQLITINCCRASISLAKSKQLITDDDPNSDPNFLAYQILFFAQIESVQIFFERSPEAFLNSSKVAA